MNSNDGVARNGPDRVSDRVGRELMARIAAGEFAPGERLPGERQLAESMGVSRVSVRAALQALKTRGLIEAVQGGGTRVVATDGEMDRPLTELVRHDRRNLNDLAEIRAALEIWAADRAARHAGPEHIARLETVLAEMEDDCTRGRRKSEADVRFHLAIGQATGSAVYMHIGSIIRDVVAQMIDYYHHELFDNPADERSIVTQHAAILDGIRNHDPGAAARAMRDHLDWVARRYREAADGSKAEA